MERKIKFSDLTSTIENAYNELSKNTEGEIPEAFGKDNAGIFGITLILNDGRKYNIGDTATAFTLGGMANVPIMVQLLTQYSVEELTAKLAGKCCCAGKCDKDALKGKHFHKRGLRELSLVEPTGDIDGKMDIMSDMMTSLMASSPVMSDTLYKARMAENINEGAVNLLAEAEYFLYDDAALTLDAYARLHSMQVTTEQLAAMGATITADGVNPVTKQNVFDGKNSANIIANMAVSGPHKAGRRWLTITGIPAVASYGGGMLAVVPGLGAIAAFSPELNAMGIPVKAALSLKKIFTDLQLNAFASARVAVE
ncbi:MAG: glutaminase [Lachnoclostridium sp.]|nr:glutaminase [Lachnoclostridium sp.]